VVELFRGEGVTNVRWVWSPAGNSGLEAYYPGDDVVDYIGLTVLEDPIWDEGFGLRPQSFTQLLRPRYERVVPMNKPILVAELGVSDDLERQASWLADAAVAVSDFPEVRAMIYFNDVNAPSTLSTQPDWRVPAQLFSQFVDSARRSEIRGGR
jgi:beta-mannanase